jgi:hypothetical protein
VFTLALVIVGLLALLVASRRSELRPPAVTLVKMEPAGIFDDNGEMSLLTLNMDCPYNPLRPEETLVVRIAQHSIRARVSNRWVEVEGIISWHSVSTTNLESQLLIPAGADSCRFTVQYTCRTRSFNKHPFRGRVEWLAEQLPLRLRRRLSPAFWRWAGWPQYRPSSNWRALSMEMPFPPQTAQPPPAPVRSHTPVTALDAGSARSMQTVRRWAEASEFLC